MIQPVLCTDLQTAGSSRVVSTSKGFKHQRGCWDCRQTPPPAPSATLGSMSNPRSRAAAVRSPQWPHTRITPSRFSHPSQGCGGRGGTGSLPLSCHIPDTPGLRPEPSHRELGAQGSARGEGLGPGNTLNYPGLSPRIRISYQARETYGPHHAKSVPELYDVTGLQVGFPKGILLFL